jgi:hypothetical protein
MGTISFIQNLIEVKKNKNIPKGDIIWKKLISKTKFLFYRHMQNVKRVVLKYTAYS